MWGSRGAMHLMHAVHADTCRIPTQWHPSAHLPPYLTHPPPYPPTQVIALKMGLTALVLPSVAAAAAVTALGCAALLREHDTGAPCTLHPPPWLSFLRPLPTSADAIPIIRCMPACLPACLCSLRPDPHLGAGGGVRKDRVAGGGAHRARRRPAAGRALHRQRAAQAGRWRRRRQRRRGGCARGGGEAAHDAPQQPRRAVAQQPRRAVAATCAARALHALHCTPSLPYQSSPPFRPLGGCTSSHAFASAYPFSYFVMYASDIVQKSVKTNGHCIAS